MNSLLFATIVVSTCLGCTSHKALLRTFRAVCQVESGNDPNAYNQREDAAGIAQIRPIMIRDANRIIGREKWTLADRWDPKQSFQVFSLIVRYYRPNGGPQQWARIWNGGPHGDTKPATIPYWLKVQREMNKASE
jgi:hypothetical protein